MPVTSAEINQLVNNLLARIPDEPAAVQQGELNENDALQVAPDETPSDFTIRLNEALHRFSHDWLIALDRNALAEENRCPPGWDYCSAEEICVPSGSGCNEVLSFEQATAQVSFLTEAYFSFAESAEQQERIKGLLDEMVQTLEPVLKPVAAG